MVNLTWLAVSLAAVAPTIAATLAQSGNKGSAKYIITLRSGISDSEAAEHMSYARAAHKRSVERRNLKDLLDGTEASGSGWHIHKERNLKDLLDGNEGVGKEWHIHEQRSYTGVFDRDTLDELEAHHLVEAVEPATTMRIHDTTKQLYAPWGLGSISHTYNKTVRYVYDDSAMGDGYYAYVIDTGIRTTHVDLEGRAIFGYNAVANEEAEDLNGHGTHVAGTIGSKTFGVAKGCTLIAAKACDADGSCTTEALLDALQFVWDHASNHSGIATSVINMSVGGGNQTALTKAVETLAQAGFSIAVSAGNDDTDANDTAPANAPEAITVGAIDYANQRASFSNWGSRLDLFAPGVDIMSLGHESDTATKIMSGTSMASPHVAGLILYLKDKYGLKKPEDVREKLLKLALENVVTDPNGSPNYLANNGETDADSETF
jgi:oryzin